MDPEFTLEERAAIAAAVEKWDTIATTPVDGWRIVRRDPPWPKELGHSDEDLREIIVRPGLPPARFYGVVLHELGHAHGIWVHVDAGVMQAEVFDPPLVEFSCEDLAACRSVGACE